MGLMPEWLAGHLDLCWRPDWAAHAHSACLPACLPACLLPCLASFLPSWAASVGVTLPCARFAAPQVHEMVRGIFKKEPNRSMNPDEVRRYCRQYNMQYSAPAARQLRLQV